MIQNYFPHDLMQIAKYTRVSVCCSRNLRYISYM